MASMQKEAHSGISTSRSSYFSLVCTSHVARWRGGARIVVRVAVGSGRGTLHAHARVSKWICREIKKRKNLVFTESSTIRKILYPRKFPAIRYTSTIIIILLHYTLPRKPALLAVHQTLDKGGKKIM